MAHNTRSIQCVVIGQSLQVDHVLVVDVGELLTVLLVVVVLMVGTGVTAVFKGKQIRQWLRKRERALKKAHRGNSDSARGEQAQSVPGPNRS